MKTREFLQLLEDNKDTSLLFEYAPNQLVGANYHITEVKHMKIDSVDCGARVDAWNETIIQLWESPSELGKTEFMSSFKALGILNKVGKMKSYDLESEVKFEYSNALFHTAQLFVNDYNIQTGKLLLSLAIEKTDCKAKEECGIPASDGVPSKALALEQENTSNEKLLIATEEACCTPGGGCC